MLTAFASTYRLYFVIFTFFPLLDQACGLVESLSTYYHFYYLCPGGGGSMQLAPRYPGTSLHCHSLAGRSLGWHRPHPPPGVRMARRVSDGHSVPVGCRVWWPGLRLTLTGVSLVPQWPGCLGIDSAATGRSQPSQQPHWHNQLAPTHLLAPNSADLQPQLLALQFHSS